MRNFFYISEPIVVFSRFKKWRENSPFLGVLVKAWARWASAAIANAPWMLTLTILNIVKVEERQRSCLAGEGARAQGCSVVDVVCRYAAHCRFAANVACFVLSSFV